ncbi:MAG: hypothetical protein Q8907_10005 [Bacteroidota bacterium]|nr:hypothetical protein [Bacteroidota bacterium]
MKSRRKYDRDFKQIVVELFYKPENIEDMAAESGIRKYLCYLWLIEFLIRLKREEARFA